MIFFFLIVLVGLVFVSYRYRAAKIATVVVVLVAIAIWPTLKSIQAAITAEGDSTTITNYQLDYTLNADGTLDLSETITVRFTESRRGIFRFFDQEGPDGAPHPTVVHSVQRCNSSGEKCAPEPYTEDKQDGELVAKIGQASVSYPAGTTQVYKIDSSTVNAITGSGGDAQWYWNVIGQGWQMDIDKATISAKLPKPPVGTPRCATNQGDCQISIAGETATTTVTNLAPRTATTWQLDFDPAGLKVYPVTPSPLHNPVVQALLVVLGLVLAFLFWALIRRNTERAPAEAPLFEAPSRDLLGAAWTLREEPPADSFQAMLMYLNDLDVVDIKAEMSGETVSKTPAYFDVQRSPDPLPSGLPGAADVLGKVGLRNLGSSVRIEKKDKEMGAKVQSAQKAARAAATAAAFKNFYATKSGLGQVLQLVSVALPVVALAAIYATDSRYVALLFAIPAIAGLWADKSTATQLTSQGLAMRDRVNGLRIALRTKASIERFDYSLRARYFQQFLPWAIALGCADEWADACKPDTPGQEFDHNYLLYTNTYYMSNALTSTVSSVSASAVSAYSASQAGSGGGGGFSAGGGGGGGGGGSW